MLYMHHTPSSKISKSISDYFNHLSIKILDLRTMIYYHCTNTTLFPKVNVCRPLKTNPLWRRLYNQIREDNLEEKKNDPVTNAIEESKSANMLSDPKNYIYIWNEKKNEYDIIDGKTGKLIVVMAKDDLIFNSAEYTHAAGEVVCEAIRSGMTMKKILNDERLPSPSAIYSWKRMHPEFAKKFEMAMRDRANYYHDEAVSAVEEVSLHKDEVPYLKLKVDTLKWAAEKADPERFGTKKGDLHVNTPSVIVLNTGINRKDAPSIDELLKAGSIVDAEFKNINKDEP